MGATDRQGIGDILHCMPHRKTERDLVPNTKVAKPYCPTLPQKIDDPLIKCDEGIVIPPRATRRPAQMACRPSRRRALIGAQHISRRRWRAVSHDPLYQSGVPGSVD